MSGHRPWPIIVFGSVKSVILHSDVVSFFIDVHLQQAKVFSCVYKSGSNAKAPFALLSVSLSNKTTALF